MANNCMKQGNAFTVDYKGNVQVAGAINSSALTANSIDSASIRVKNQVSAKTVDVESISVDDIQVSNKVATSHVTSKTVTAESVTITNSGGAKSMNTSEPHATLLGKNMFLNIFL